MLESTQLFLLKSNPPSLNLSFSSLSFWIWTSVNGSKHIQAIFGVQWWPVLCLGIMFLARGLVINDFGFLGLGIVGDYSYLWTKLRITTTHRKRMLESHLTFKPVLYDSRHHVNQYLLTSPGGVFDPQPCCPPSFWKILQFVSSTSSVRWQVVS